MCQRENRISGLPKEAQTKGRHPLSITPVSEEQEGVVMPEKQKGPGVLDSPTAVPLPLRRRRPGDAAWPGHSSLPPSSLQEPDLDSNRDPDHL